MNDDIRRFEFQTRLLEKGADELQDHISRLDEILSKTKAACVAVWVAIIGWAFTTNNVPLIALGAMVLTGFWLLEGFFRGVQARYFAHSVKLTQFFNDRKALDECFKSQEYPAGLVNPMTFQESEWTKLKMYWRGLSAPSTVIFYAFLGFVNYLIWISG